jgi:undecaprenyl diphosphate synthase
MGAGRASAACRGRWATVRALRLCAAPVRAAMELAIPYLTIYSFSSENWSRPAEEIQDLMGLMKRFIRRDLAELHQKNVRVIVIGERDNIENEMMVLIDETRELTASNTGLTLVIAFNYGSRAEIAKAARKLAQEAVDGRRQIDDITVESLSACLDTAGIPDPDLLIRTSGEMRLSNFLLWQCAYAELVFLDVYWPDFGREHLEQAIASYRARDRRFGGLNERPAVLGARDAG